MQTRVSIQFRSEDSQSFELVLRVSERHMLYSQLQLNEREGLGSVE